jgi:hypothetical protein
VMDIEKELEEFIDSISHHSPSNAQVIRINRIRQAAAEFATTLVNSTPQGRCKSLAKTHFEESVMWATKGIVLEVADEPPAD